MNLEPEADCSDFRGNPEVPRRLVAGRVPSDPERAFLGAEPFDFSRHLGAVTPINALPGVRHISLRNNDFVTHRDHTIASDDAASRCRSADEY